MKKNLLFLFASAVICTASMNAQSTLNTYSPETIVGNETTLAHSSVKIINTGSSTVTVKVEMDNFSANPSHVTYFCWGVICYPPTTFVSPTPVDIAPGDTNSSFIGYLQPNGVVAQSVVKYNFFNVADPTDVVEVIFNYNITTGIDELKNSATVSEAFPNPANNLTRISYDLKSSKNASLMIYNILGSVVNKIDLTDNNGTLILTTSGLQSGIYYYSIVADGKVMPAKKLIVAHR